MTTRVSVNIINQIAHVTLCRADKHNALDMAMFHAIDKTIKTLRKNRNIRAVILAGEGADFCSGLDVKSVMMSPLSGAKLLWKLFPWRSNLAQRVSTGWRTIPVPVFCLIQGRCWGGGLQIALGADFTIASPTAEFAIMESRWGLIPDMGGTLVFQELLKLPVAKELAMTAATIDSCRALALGLISHVDENPQEKALQMITTICQQSPDSVAAVKKLYNKSWYGSKGLALLRESYYQIRILLGKNMKIKIFNQTHELPEAKTFAPRKRW